MLRLRTAAGVLMSLGLAAVMVVPVRAEPAPPTLSIETQVTHYLGGWWEQEIPFNLSCDGYGSLEVMVDLPGGTDGNVIEPLGPVPAGTRCWIEVSSYPQPGDNADWNEETYEPGWEFWLAEGDTHVTMTIPRVWAMEWPPQDDRWEEHELQLTVERVYLNGKGGIEVEGTSSCPEAADILEPGSDQMVFGNARWSAVQYVGRKTALTTGWDSAVAHPCWAASDPDHGPYAWETRYPYPSAAIEWMYATNGKFGSGSIHVEAAANAELLTVNQNFAPDGWTSFEGEYVPYDAACDDSDGDGWCVTRHVWSGWAQADLKPIRAR